MMMNIYIVLDVLYILFNLILIMARFFIYHLHVLD